MTIGDVTLTPLPDGTREATAPIGSIFGAAVEGELRGAGPTKEAALDALIQKRRSLHDSLWA